MKRLFVVSVFAALAIGAAGCESMHCYRAPQCNPAPMCAPVDPCGGAPSFTTPSYSTPGAVQMVQPGPVNYVPAQ